MATSKQGSKHTHTHVRNAVTSVGLAQVWVALYVGSYRVIQGEKIAKME